MNNDKLQRLSRARIRIAVLLSSAVIVLYFGFIALIAFRKDVLARVITPGLTLGVLLGVIVIVASWLLTWVYVRWAAKHYDPALEEHR
jgi:uncharacterized membrane protein (DUF485 family)